MSSSCSPRFAREQSYQGTVPCRSWKVPVGPSGGRVASERLLGALGGDGLRAAVVVEVGAGDAGVGRVHEDGGQRSRVLHRQHGHRHLGGRADRQGHWVLRRARVKDALKRPDAAGDVDDAPMLGGAQQGQEGLRHPYRAEDVIANPSIAASAVNSAAPTRGAAVPALLIRTSSSPGGRGGTASSLRPSSPRARCCCGISSRRRRRPCITYSPAR